MSLFAAVLALTLCVGVILIVALYRGLRPRGKGLALSAAGLLAVAAIALLPLPGHGSFTLLGEVLWRAAGDLVERAQAPRDALRLRRAPRFAGTLPHTPEGSPIDGWQRVAVGDAVAWLDTRSGLIFGASLFWTAAQALPALDAAKAACQARPPRGFWALPDAAEMILFEQAGGARHLPHARQGSVYALWQPDLGIELPQYHVGPEPGFALRCVARSAGAPENGFSQADLPLEVWNAQQLRRLRQ